MNFDHNRNLIGIFYGIIYEPNIHLTFLVQEFILTINCYDEGTINPHFYAKMLKNLVEKNKKIVIDPLIRTIVNFPNFTINPFVTANKVFRILADTQSSTILIRCLSIITKSNWLECTKILCKTTHAHPICMAGSMFFMTTIRLFATKSMSIYDPNFILNVRSIMYKTSQHIKNRQYQKAYVRVFDKPEMDWEECNTNHILCGLSTFSTAIRMLPTISPNITLLPGILTERLTYFESLNGNSKIHKTIFLITMGSIFGYEALPSSTTTNFKLFINPLKKFIE